MLKKVRYTFVVAGYPGTTIRRITLSQFALVVLGLVALLGLLTAGMATHQYFMMLGQVADHNRLLSENDSFRAENQNYRIQTAQLGEKIDHLETLARQVTILSGMNSEDSPGGVGGISAETLDRPLPLSGGSIQAIDLYNQSVTQLEDKYRGVKDFLNDRALLAAATPAFLPVRGYVTAKMGMRHDPFNESLTDYHTGVDISAPYGTRVVAPADGTVIFAGQRDGYGNIVVIDHKFGIMTRYGHLWKANVQAGDHVSRSDVIGYIGMTGRTTGPHLHFELYIQNRPVNPIAFLNRFTERKTG